MRTIERTENYEVVELTTDELTEILKNVEFGTLCYYISETIPVMVKKSREDKTIINPYHNKVTKLSKCRVFLGGQVDEDEMTVYQKRVIKKTGNQDFVPQENKVGQHVEGSVILFNEKLNRYYLQYERFNEVPTKSEFFFEGNIVDKMLFQDFLNKSYPSKTGVLTQSVKMTNLKEVHLDHVHYKVVNEVLIEG